MRNLCMALIFQLGWFACVVCGAKGWPLAALAAAAAVVACNLWLQRGNLAKELRLLAWVTLTGVGIETFHLWAGVFMLAGQPKHPWLCPVWLVVLWTMFATLLRGPLAWLSGRYALSALLGAAFAAPNYIAGARLGAVTLSSSMLFNVTVLMATWAIAMPGLVWLATVTKTKRRCP